MKRKVILMLCMLLLFGTVIGNIDSLAAGQVPAGYSYYATYDGGCKFYRDAYGNTVCFDAAGDQVFNQFKCDGTYTYFFQADGTAMRDRLTYHPDGVHVIYFDSNGHEVFSDFAHVKMSIAGTPVNDFCFFDVYGYLYVDVLTYDKAGKVLYYANPYGVMEVGKWFQFSNTVKWADGRSAADAAGKYGYANADGTLMTSTWTYNWNGQAVYLQANGANATGTIADDDYYYNLDPNDGHLISQIPVPNEISQVVDPNPSNYTYGELNYVMTKAYFENGVLKADFYMINSSYVETVTRISDITVTIKDCNKGVIASQTFYDIQMNLAPWKYKTITLTFNNSNVYNPNYKLKYGISYDVSGEYYVTY